MSVSERVRKHRNKLREKGYRPVQFWIPDTRSSEFIEECKKQSRLLQNDPQEKEILGWFEDGSDLSNTSTS